MTTGAGTTSGVGAESTTGVGVELTDLTRVYGSVKALDGLTLHAVQDPRGHPPVVQEAALRRQVDRLFRVP